MKNIVNILAIRRLMFFTLRPNRVTVNNYVNLSITINYYMIQQVFIISDGTGRTAEQVLNAALMQFENSKVQTIIYPHVSTEKQILEIIAEASLTKSLVVFTVVSKMLRDVINKQGRLYDVETIDLIGPLLAHFSHHFSHLPSEKPGIYYELNKHYFKRIEAVEYTLRHDDGQRIEELEYAYSIFKRQARWTKIDVTNKPIEEISMEILSGLRKSDR